MRRACCSAFWLCRATCSMGKLRNHNLFPAEQWPLCSAECIKKVRTIHWKQKSALPLCHMSWYTSAHQPYLLFHHPQHHSISFTISLLLSTAMALASCQPSLCWWLCCILSLALLLHWVWHCLALKRPPPALMEAAALPTATSISPCGYSLSQPGQSWHPAAVASVFSCHVLQFLVLPKMQELQKITVAVFVAVAFSDIKAWWGCISGRGIFCTCRATKESYWFLTFLFKAIFISSNNQPLDLINPSPPDLWSHGRRGWEKMQSTNLYIFMNWDILWFA